ncbi:hypothetical protein ACO1Y7_25020, partial [Klebsiella quasipneumoniae subsp. similipneumoniae]|uniref:hypothetical protein n=1 Tax=Klebsiella quasipneumoniae TaxID=1463165 RepID=UPI003BF6FB8B
VSSHKQLLGNTQNSRHRYAASTSGNPSFSVLRQLQYLCELTHGQKKTSADKTNRSGGKEIKHRSLNKQKDMEVYGRLWT